MAIDWMETLESRVREAAEEIRRVRGENETLKARLLALETELADARRATAKTAAAKGSVGAKEADVEWEKEREEVRQRVERLVKQLEGLIQEAEVGET